MTSYLWLVFFILAHTLHLQQVLCYTHTRQPWQHSQMTRQAELCKIQTVTMSNVGRKQSQSTIILTLCEIMNKCLVSAWWQLHTHKRKNYAFFLRQRQDSLQNLCSWPTQPPGLTFNSLWGLVLRTKLPRGKIWGMHFFAFLPGVRWGGWYKSFACVLSTELQSRRSA